MDNKRGRTAVDESSEEIPVLLIFMLSQKTPQADQLMMSCCALIGCSRLPPLPLLSLHLLLLSVLIPSITAQPHPPPLSPVCSPLCSSQRDDAEADDADVTLCSANCQAKGKRKGAWPEPGAGRCWED
ncbi:hypothetical protein FQA47_021983 [Oryzias melastigma]|uniref:Uncharacterized protein n=1 Tax=Oryzias melastigma TaxID=30732 RepID=A0A834C6P8_ORYME|nr:hypothetical protein FQA47_021983 [Oryzias melastigma]